MTIARAYFVTLRQNVNSSQTGDCHVTVASKASFESEFNLQRLSLIDKRANKNSDFFELTRQERLLQDRKSLVKAMFAVLPMIDTLQIVETHLPAEPFQDKSKVDKIKDFIGKTFRSGIQLPFCYAFGFIFEPLKLDERSSFQAIANDAYHAFRQTQYCFQDPNLKGISGLFDPGWSIVYRNSRNEGGWDSIPSVETGISNSKMGVGIPDLSTLKLL